MISLHRDELLATRAPSGVMAGISVSDIAFPLSQTEATNHMTVTERQCTNKSPAMHSWWWLRSPGDTTTWVRNVSGGVGAFSNANVTITAAVRPAL